MAEKYPLVSIIVATFERAHLIEQSLESIRNQTYGNWECIVVDDGSTDDTKEILSALIKTDSRFIYRSRSESYKKGLPGARNMGLDLAKGDLIVFIDDDDIVHPQNLETNVHFLATCGKSFCRYGKEPFFGEWKVRKFPVIDESELQISIVNRDKVGEVLKGEIAFASCTVMWKKNCFIKNRFNEELLYAEEWELYTRILLQGFEGISIDQVLYYNRKHPHSNTGEFYNNDPIRKSSKIQAIKLVLGHLDKEGLLSRDLETYFLRLGFFLRDPSVLECTLHKCGAGFLKRIKYRMGLKFYFLLRPLFVLKSKL